MNAPSNVKKVSVIIPTYNRESILPKAIESVLRQTYPAIELIVIDDGSKDNTKQLVESYPGITYVFQENGGQGKARNTGLELATGYYLASLDSDDTWEPDFLSVCISKLEKDGLDFVFANWTQVMIDGTSIDFFKQRLDNIFCIEFSFSK
jgi:glycosyltransferase involved in cell wall biosynthesis